VCGVAASIGARADERVGRMLDAMRSRGPDDQRVVGGPRFSVGAARLAIVGGPEAAQPVRSGDGSVVVAFNGEIYNYQSLRERTRREQGRPVRSEAELLLESFRSQGPGFARALDGDFAIVVVDERRGACHLIRDPRGVKPLYYTQADAKAHADARSRWLVASELRGLVVDPGVVVEWDEVALAERAVVTCTSVGATCFRGIRSVPPGCVVTLPLAGADPSRSVELAPYAAMNSPETGVDPDALAILCAEDLREAVRKRVAHADRRPVAVALSGGLDSSVVAALARDAASDVVTVTVADRPDSTDVVYATRVARALGLEHHVHWIREADLLAELPRIVLAQAHTGPGYTPYFLGQAVRRTVSSARVLLCGEGADETFSGYWMHVEPDTFVRRSVRRLRRLDEELVARSSLLRRVAGWARGGPGVYDDVVDLIQHEQLVSRHLLPFDHGTMAHAIECRVPYLDPAVTDRIAQIPPAARVVGQTSKPLLRLVLGEVLGGQVELANAILTRPPLPAPAATTAARASLARLLERTLPRSRLASSWLAGFAQHDEDLFWLGAVEVVFKQHRGDVHGMSVADLYEAALAVGGADPHVADSTRRERERRPRAVAR
jgi:asparagine synthase (glutamine-hydrolysing)